MAPRGKVYTLLFVISKKAQRILAQIDGGKFITFSRKAKATIAACRELQALPEVPIDVHAHGGEYLVCEKGARVMTLRGAVGG